MFVADAAAAAAVVVVVVVVVVAFSLCLLQSKVTWLGHWNWGTQPQLL